MKKLLFTAGTVAVLALASCSNDEIENLNPTASGLIRYNAVVKTTTRANTLWESYNKPSDFTVFARTNGDNKLYINGDVVKLTDGEYIPVNERYWPENKLDFLAYKGHDVVDANADKTFDPASGLTLKNIQLSPFAEDQEDMIFAIAENQSGKTTTTSNVDGVETTTVENNPVSLNFRHALAQLNFRFVNNNPNIRVWVDEVRICGINNTAKSVVYSFDNTTDGQYLEDGTGNNDVSTNLTWDNRGQGLNGASTDDLVERKSSSGSRSYNLHNWSFASLKGNKTLLSSTAKQLNSAAVEPVAEDYFPLIALDGESDEYKAGAKEQQAADFDALTKNAESLAGTAPDEVQDPGDSATDEEKAAYQKYCGAQAQYAQDADLTFADLLASYKSDYTDYVTATQTDRKDNAVYVIPQETKQGEVGAPTGNFEIGGKAATLNILRDVTGMYFLIKCSIQNVTNRDEEENDDDIYLHGGKNETAYVFVPLVQSDYKPSAGDNGEETTKYITEWKSGKKYIYTFFFGEKGSNGGIPVTDPDPEDPGKDPGVDPDPDPDDDSIIDTTDPTLRLITYSAEEITVDDYQKYETDDQDVNYTK